MTTDDTALAQRLLDDGASYREVARTIGISRSVVMRALPGQGWTYRDAGHFTASTRWIK